MGAHPASLDLAPHEPSELRVAQGQVGAQGHEEVERRRPRPEDVLQDVEGQGHGHGAGAVRDEDEDPLAVDGKPPESLPRHREELLGGQHPFVETAADDAHGTRGRR